jgi:thiamine pyrophosphokinase
MGGTCLLVLAGQPPSDELITWRMEEADYSIAVDGGYLSFRQAGLVPDTLIGDMDSLSEEERPGSEFPELKVMHLHEQDSTDFEKALNWIQVNTNIKKLIILGGLGKRTDHLTTNLLVASVADQSLEITFDDDQEWMRRVTPSCPLSLHGRKGANLSILPLCESSGVTTKGLQWELNSENIGGSKIVGQSNRCKSDLVEIKCETGNFFVFLEKG